MKTTGLILVLLLVVCEHASSQEITYEEAINACGEKMRIIQEKYPGNKLIAVRPDCLYGAKLPDFIAQDLEGRTITTDSLSGKKTIINFWFTSCPPCIKEMPWLNRLKQELGSERYNYIAICKDSDADTKEFLEKHKFEFSIIGDGRALIEDTFGHIWDYPFTIIADENLRIIDIIGTNSTEEAFRTEILSALDH